MSEFRWVHVKNKHEMEAFYHGILPKLREAARAEGYALGLHGSLRRDLDLIAVPWVEKCSDKETLARALHRAACGIESQTYHWEQKPHGRAAASFPICFPDFHDGTQLSLGHIDLSVMLTGEDDRNVR